MIVLEILATWVLYRLGGISLPIGPLLILSFLRLIELVLLFYTFALLIYVLLSWFGGGGRNPMAVLLGEIVEPILRPARRLVPPIGGIDLSPLIVIVLLQFAMILLRSAAPGVG
jgi:YggT family protein